jgi:hypothetical protein
MIDRAVLTNIDASHGPAVAAWAATQLADAEATATAVLHRALRADAAGWREWLTDALTAAQLLAIADDHHHDFDDLGAGDVLHQLAVVAAKSAVTAVERRPTDPSRIY